jgi:hypothetical protein
MPKNRNKLYSALRGYMSIPEDFHPEWYSMDKIAEEATFNLARNVTISTRRGEYVP